MATATRGGEERERDPDRLRSGRRRLPSRSEIRPEPMRAAIASTLITASTAPAASRRDVTVLVEEEHDEARDPDLRQQVEAGAGAEQPHERVAQRLRDVAELGLLRSIRPRTKTAATIAPVTRGAGEEEEGEARAAGRGERGERGRGERAADRDRRLPDPEREAELGRREPGHDRAAARGVHARAQRADERRERP